MSKLNLFLWHAKWNLAGRKSQGVLPLEEGERTRRLLEMSGERRMEGMDIREAL